MPCSLPSTARISALAASEQRWQSTCHLDRAAAGLIYASTKYSDLSNRMTTIGWAVTPGIIYPINDHWNLLTTFGSLGWGNSEYEGQHVRTWQCDLFQSVSLGFVLRI